MSTYQLATAMALAARAATISPAASEEARSNVKQAEPTSAENITLDTDMADDWSEIEDETMAVIERHRDSNGTESEDDLEAEIDDDTDQPFYDDCSGCSECEESEEERQEEEPKDDTDEASCDTPDTQSCTFCMSEVERANAAELAAKVLKTELVDCMGGKIKAEAFAEERAFEIDVWKKAHDLELERNHHLTSKAKFTKQKVKEQMEILKDTAAFHIRLAQEAENLQAIDAQQIEFLYGELEARDDDSDTLEDATQLLVDLEIENEEIQEECEILRRELAEEVQEHESVQLAWLKSSKRCDELQKKSKEETQRCKDAERDKKGTSEWCTELARMLEDETQQRKALEASNKELANTMASLHMQLSKERQEREVVQHELALVKAEGDSLEEAAEEYISMQESEMDDASKLLEVFFYMYPGLEKLSGEDLQEAMLEMSAKDKLNVGNFQDYLVGL